MDSRCFLRAAKRIRLSPNSLRTRQPRFSSSKSTEAKAPPVDQAIPIGGYYSWILDSPDPPTTTPPHSLQHPSESSNDSSTKHFNTRVSTEDNPDPNILFTSRTVKLRERAEDKSRKSTQVAGVWIPPKPEEPDDCCMSGCVNCVWDRYQDEMEEYLGAKRLADAAVKAEGQKGGEAQVAPAGMSMDDDGGGSEGNWNDTVKDKVKDDPFKDVPVGIREFMRLERKLKETTKSL